MSVFRRGVDAIGDTDRFDSERTDDPDRDTSPKRAELVARLIAAGGSAAQVAARIDDSWTDAMIETFCGVALGNAIIREHRAEQNRTAVTDALADARARADAARDQMMADSAAAWRTPAASITDDAPSKPTGPRDLAAELMDESRNLWRKSADEI